MAFYRDLKSFLARLEAYIQKECAAVKLRMASHSEEMLAFIEEISETNIENPSQAETKELEAILKEKFAKYPTVNEGLKNYREYEMKLAAAKETFLYDDQVRRGVSNMQQLFSLLYSNSDKINFDIEGEDGAFELIDAGKLALEDFFELLPKYKARLTLSAEILNLLSWKANPIYPT